MCMSHVEPWEVSKIWEIFAYLSFYDQRAGVWDVAEEAEGRQQQSGKRMQLFLFLQSVAQYHICHICHIWDICHICTWSGGVQTFKHSKSLQWSLQDIIPFRQVNPAFRMYTWPVAMFEKDLTNWPAHFNLGNPNQASVLAAGLLLSKTRWEPISVSDNAHFLSFLFVCEAKYNHLEYSTEGLSGNAKTIHL